MREEASRRLPFYDVRIIPFNLPRGKTRVAIALARLFPLITRRRYCAASYRLIAGTRRLFGRRDSSIIILESFGIIVGSVARYIGQRRSRRSLSPETRFTSSISFSLSLVRRSLSRGSRLVFPLENNWPPDRDAARVAATRR